MAMKKYFNVDGNWIPVVQFLANSQMTYPASLLVSFVINTQSITMCIINSLQMVCRVMVPFTDVFRDFSQSCQTHKCVVTIHFYPCFQFGVNNHASLLLYGANEIRNSIQRFNKLARETTEAEICYAHLQNYVKRLLVPSRQSDPRLTAWNYSARTGRTFT